MRKACVGAAILALTVGVTASGMERPAKRPRNAASPSERPEGTAAPRPRAPKDAQQRQAITSTATAILVDAVVRDKHGKLLTDLSASDFEVFEDGAAQAIDSFTRVSHGAGSASES